MFLAVQVFGEDQAHTESPRHSDDISADFKRMLVKLRTLTHLVHVCASVSVSIISKLVVQCYSMSKIRFTAEEPWRHLSPRQL